MNLDTFKFIAGTKIINLLHWKYKTKFVEQFFL